MAGNISKMTIHDWILAQEDDPLIHKLMKFVHSRKLHKYKLPQDASDEEKQFHHIRYQLKLRHGVLYRRYGTEFKLVLPYLFRRKVLTGCHDDLGHHGIERTLSVIRDRFYWPRLADDVKAHIKNCRRCILAKAESDLAPMEPIEATYPLELVHICLLYTSPSPRDS